MKFQYETVLNSTKDKIPHRTKHIAPDGVIATKAFLGYYGFGRKKRLIAVLVG